MVTQTVSCYHCGGLDLIRHGKAPNGKRKFRCKTCGQYSRENKGSNAYDAEFQAAFWRPTTSAAPCAAYAASSGSAAKP